MFVRFVFPDGCGLAGNPDWNHLALGAVAPDERRIGPESTSNPLPVAQILISVCAFRQRLTACIVGGQSIRAPSMIS